MCPLFLGAAILFLLSLFLTEPIVNFIKWMEERLLKAPIFDLLFGTLGLIVGLSVAFLVSFGVSEYSDTGYHICLADSVIDYSWLFRFPSRF